MKTTLIHSLFLPLLSTLASTAVAARADRGEEERQDVVTRNELVPLRDIRSIKLGMTREEVLASMRGKADDALTNDVWIYWEFAGNRRPAGMERPALLVFFVQGKVADIRYSEGRLVRETLMRHRAAMANSSLAAK